MEDLKIKFAVLWIAVMLCYLLGDVIRIFSGTITLGEIDGKPVSKSMWFLITIIMVIPILMIVISILLPLGSLNIWLNLIFAIMFLIFNLMGIRGYEAFDVFLLIISFGFNGLTIWLAIQQLKTR